MATNSKTRAKRKRMKAKNKNSFPLFVVKEGRMDYPFLILVILLLTVGLVALFSSSFANAYHYYGNSFHFTSRQLIFAVIGLGTMLFVSTINHEIYNRILWPLYTATILLLMWVLTFPPISGARRWIIIGSFTFQPSEIAKFTVVILFAHLIVLNYKRMNTFRYGIMPPILMLAPIVGLVIIEPHLSGTILILSIAAVMLFVGGVEIKWFVLLGIVGGIGLWLVLGTDIIPYAMTRIEIWRDPASDPRGNGYQTLQSLYAIGSGGFMGEGIGASSQKYLYLPELQNDYIFAIVCEELGFIGVIVIVSLFAMLVWRGIHIGTRCPDKFGSLVAIGLSVQVGVQAILNMMVVTNMIPSTGISLPFFSYGGTSLIMLLAQMGIVLSISRHTNKGEYIETEIVIDK